MAYNLTCCLFVQFYCNGRRPTKMLGKGNITLLIFSTLLCSCPARCDGNETATDKSISTLAWKLMKAFEIANWILAIVVGLLGLLIPWFILKFYKFTRCTYQMTRSLVEDIEVPRRRKKQFTNIYTQLKFRLGSSYSTCEIVCCMNCFIFNHQRSTIT